MTSHIILSTINVQNTKCKHVILLNKITHIILLHYTWYISHYSNPLACHYKISHLVWYSFGIIIYKWSCESERDRYFGVQEVCREFHWTQSFMMIRFSFQGNSLLVETFQSTVITYPMWVLGGVITVCWVKPHCANFLW